MGTETHKAITISTHAYIKIRVHQPLLSIPTKPYHVAHHILPSFFLALPLALLP